MGARAPATACPVKPGHGVSPRRFLAAHGYTSRQDAPGRALAGGQCALEGLVNPAFWSAKRVLVTGHTGFKGGWLAIWLDRLGAQVSGFALPEPSASSLFHAAKVDRGVATTYGDIRNLEQFRAA